MPYAEVAQESRAHSLERMVLCVGRIGTSSETVMLTLALCGHVSSSVRISDLRGANSTGSGKSSLVYTWFRALSGSVTGKEEFLAANVHDVSSSARSRYVTSHSNTL